MHVYIEKNMYTYVYICTNAHNHQYNRGLVEFANELGLKQDKQPRSISQPRVGRVVHHPGQVWMAVSENGVYPSNSQFSINNSG